jgi:hypothetical protein
MKRDVKEKQLLPQWKEYFYFQLTPLATFKKSKLPGKRCIPAKQYH